MKIPDLFRLFQLLYIKNNRAIAALFACITGHCISGESKQVEVKLFTTNIIFKLFIVKEQAAHLHNYTLCINSRLI